MVYWMVHLILVACRWLERNIDIVLQGVVFVLGLLVSISKSNDIALNVNPTRRGENILLPLKLPPPIQDTVAMPSTPIPLFPTMVHVVKSQGITHVPIPYKKHAM
jgi:hypothetical protein